MFTKLMSCTSTMIIFIAILFSCKSFGLHAQNPFQKDHALFGDDMCQASVLFEKLTQLTKINPITEEGMTDSWACENSSKSFSATNKKMDKAFPFQIKQINYLCRTQKKLNCFNHDAESAFCLANLKIEKSNTNYSHNFSTEQNEFKTQSIRPRFTHAISIQKSLINNSNGSFKIETHTQEWILDHSGCQILQKIN